MFERLGGFLREMGYSSHEVEAVLALRPETWADLPQRLAAVRAFAALPEAPALAAANKRVGNILKKSEGATPVDVNPALLQEDAERALHTALGAAVPQATRAVRARRLHRQPAGAGRTEGAGGCLLRRRDGQCRGRRAARQPAGAAVGPARGDEPRGRPGEAGLTMYSTKLVILGRDGILNEFREDHVKAPEEWQPIKGAMEAVSRLNHAGWHTRWWPPTSRASAAA